MNHVLSMRLVLVACVLLCTPAASRAQDTIEDFDLKDGITDENEIRVPIYDAGSMASLHVGAIERTYDSAALLFRKAGKGSAWTGSGPEYYLDKKVDLAAFLKDTLNSQGKAMGLKMVSAADGAWVLTGTLKEINFETEQTGAATLFSGTTHVELQLRDPKGSTSAHNLTLYSYSAVRRRGFGRGGRATEALAIALFQAAHEILAQLNKTAFKLPVHARTSDLLRDPGRADLNEIYRLGLTGSTELVPRLLDNLPRREEEDERMFIIEALARLGSADAVALLGQRYANEDEDCRWATIKAMGYIGGDAAMGVVRDKGLKDEYRGAQRLSEKVLAPR